MSGMEGQDRMKMGIGGMVDLVVTVDLVNVDTQFCMGTVKRQGKGEVHLWKRDKGNG